MCTLKTGEAILKHLKHRASRDLDKMNSFSVKDILNLPNSALLVANTQNVNSSGISSSESVKTGASPRYECRDLAKSISVKCTAEAISSDSGKIFIS